MFQQANRRQHHAGGSSYLLDDYPNAILAYSIARLLKSDYAGSLLRLRRSSDNGELDIGVVAGELDTATAESHCGAGNGFVTKIYDQSGSSKDRAQTTAGNQPTLVSSGFTVTQNGKPAFYADQQDDYLDTATNVGIDSATVALFLVYEADSSEFDGAVFGSSTSGTFGFIQDGNAALQYNGPVTCTFTKNGGATISPNTRGEMHTQYHTGSPVLISTDDADTSGDGTFATQGLWIGGFRTGGTYAAVRHEQEFVVYNSDQSSNKAGIDANIMAFYGIT